MNVIYCVEMPLWDVQRPYSFWMRSTIILFWPKKDERRKRLILFPLTPEWIIADWLRKCWQKKLCRQGYKFSEIHQILRITKNTRVNQKNLISEVYFFEEIYLKPSHSALPITSTRTRRSSFTRRHPHEKLTAWCALIREEHPPINRYVHSAFALCRIPRVEQRGKFPWKEKKHLTMMRKIVVPSTDFYVCQFQTYFWDACYMKVTGSSQSWQWVCSDSLSFGQTCKNLFWS